MAGLIERCPASCLNDMQGTQPRADRRAPQASRGTSPATTPLRRGPSSVPLSA